MSKQNEHFFYCPVCKFKITSSNICGRCPNCDSEGFKTLRMWYGICHDCTNAFVSEGVLQCNIHKHIPKTRCKEYNKKVD